MHPAAIEFMIRIAESTVPVVTSLAMGHVRAKADETIIKSYQENIAKQEKILDRHNHGGHGGTFHPVIPNNVGFEPVKPKLHSVKPPFIEVPKSNDLTQMHAEKWNEYWNQLYSLPDDASTGDAVKAMKKIKKDIEDYPCPSCKVNAQAHLKEMDEENDKFTRVSTKKDAVMKLCRFKNKINEMKGEEIFPCEALID